MRQATAENIAAFRKEVFSIRDEERAWFEKERETTRETEKKLRESVRERVLSSMDQIHKEALSMYQL